MPDRDGWVTIDEAAARYGVHRQTVAQRLADLPDDACRKDPRGRWMLDPATVEGVTGWAAADSAPTVAPGPVDAAAPSTTLALFDQVAPLLQRVGNAARERADAEARATIAEHRLQTAQDAATGVRAPWWLVAPPCSPAEPLWARW